MPGWMGGDIPSADGADDVGGGYFMLKRANPIASGFRNLLSSRVRRAGAHSRYFQ